MTVSTKSTGEVFESLTGFDEIAIAKAFGCDVTALKDKPMMFLRSLVFTEERRNGENDKAAKALAMDLPIGELTDYFRPDEDPETGEA